MTLAQMLEENETVKILREFRELYANPMTELLKPYMELAETLKPFTTMAELARPYAEIMEHYRHRFPATAAPDVFGGVERGRRWTEEFGRLAAPPVYRPRRLPPAKPEVEVEDVVDHEPVAQPGKKIGFEF